MVTEVVMNDRFAWLALAALLGVTAASRGERAVTIASETGAYQFGQTLGADGDLVASGDIAKGGVPVVRILRIDQKKVVEDVRFAFPKNEAISAVEVSNGRVAAKLDRAQEIAIFERGKQERIALKDNCRRGDWSFALAKDTLVVPGDKVVCIFERTKLAGKLPSTSSPNFVFTNGERVVQLKPGAYHSTIVVSRKHGGTWGNERAIELDDGRHLITAAMSNRWLVVSTRSTQWTDFAVETYELGSSIKPVGKVKFKDSVDRLAVSDTRMVATSQKHHQVFAFDKAWKPAGKLPHTDSDRVAIANLLWVGRSGVVEGYTDEP